MTPVNDAARRSGVKALTVMDRIKEWGGGDVTLNQPINLIGLATAALAHGVNGCDEPQPLSDARIMELWVQAGGVPVDVDRARKTRAMLRTMVEAWDAYWMGGRQQDAAAHFVAVVQQARALTDGVNPCDGGSNERP